MLVKENNRDMFYSNITAAILTILVVLGLTSIQPFPRRPSTELQEMKPLELQWQGSKTKNKLYAEANPSIPDNLPDETHLLSTKNQQAAQPKLDPSIKEDVTPSVTGESQNQKVIEHQLNQQKNYPQQVVKGSRKELTASPPTPKTTSVKLSVEVENGDGTQVTPIDSASGSKIINLSSQTKQENQTNGSPTQLSQKARTYQPRPKLSPDVLSGPLLRSKTRAPRNGKIAIECRLNPFGVYMQQMLRSIENQWAELIKSSYRFMQQDQILPKVTYTFTLMDDGSIRGLQKTSIGDPLNLSSELCRQAIASRVPFGEWEKEMIAEFGNSDQITITFNYR